MAIIIRGASKCSICGEVLEEGQSLVAFPHFLRQGDELWRYSDFGMHEQCFEQWEHRDAMIHKYRVFKGEIREEPEPHKTRITILGCPDDRADLLRQLREGT